MEIVIVGSGGREYSIGLALQNDCRIEGIYFYPGNGATQKLGKNINFESDTRSVSTDSTRNTKPKLAVRLKRDGLDIAVYNGCNLYILEAIIKAMNSHDR